tara:strand:+ start:4284 stop:5066 length:783 start_codon:yes stop_codon:yes gene_type:complete
MQQLIRRYTGRRGQDDTMKVPKFGTVTAYGATEGVAVAQAQQLTDAAVSVSATEVVVEVVLTRKMVRTVPSDMFRHAGKIMANAMMKKKDSDLLGQLDGFSLSLVGAGNAMLLGALHVSASRLNANSEPPDGPFFAVLHQYHWHDIADDILTLSSNALGATPMPEGPSAEILRNYRMARLANMDVFFDNNISIDSSDDAISGVFDRESTILYDWQEPETRRGEDMGMRGERLMVIADYGVTEYVDGWGVEIKADATAPTA